MPVIFISYRDYEHQKIEQLVRVFRNRGHVVNFVPWAQQVGTSLLEWVPALIKESNYFLFCHPATGGLSDWMREEFRLAASWRISQKRPRILPARFGPYEPLPALDGVMPADFTREWEFGIRQLMRAIEEPNTSNPSVRVIYAPDDRDAATPVCDGLVRAGYRVVAPEYLAVGQSPYEERADSLLRRDPVVVHATRRVVGSRSIYVDVRDSHQKHCDCLVLTVESDAHLTLWSEFNLKPDQILTHDGSPIDLLERLQTRLASSPAIERQRREAEALRAYVEAVRRECERPATPHGRPSTGRETQFVRPILQKATDPLAQRCEVDELLKPGARSVVFGQTGSGKSTLVKWLASQLTIQKGTDLTPYRLTPVVTFLRYARLDNFTGGVVGLAASIQDRLGLRRSDIDLMRDWLPPAVAIGDVVVLVDGMDQWDCRDLGTVTDTLCRLAEDHPRVRLIVTARESSAAIRRLDFQEYRLALLDEQSQRTLLQALGPSASRHAVSALVSIPRTPLDLEVRAPAASLVGGESLPTLIRGAIVRLLEWREPSIDPVDAEVEQLGYLALRSRVEPAVTMTRSVACQWLRAFRDDHRRVYANAVEATVLLWLRRGTLLSEAAPSVPVPNASRSGHEAEIVFLHAYYRDYLAAEAVTFGWVPRCTTQQAGGDVQFWQIHDVLEDHESLKHWKDVVQLWLLLDGSVEALTEVNSTYDREDENVDAKLVRADIAMAAILDGLDMAAETRTETLRSFALAVASSSTPDIPMAAMPTLERIVWEDAWRAAFLEIIDDEKANAEDDRERDALERLAGFVNKNPRAAHRSSPDAAAT